MNYKIGDKVEWLGNGYTIVGITNKGVILKQNFSIGTILTSPIPIEQISLIKSWQKNYFYYIYYCNLGTNKFTKREFILKIIIKHKF